MINQNLQQQEKEIHQLFESLKKGNNMVQVDQLFQLIQEIGVDGGCTIITKKLQKLRGQELNYQQYKSIFSTDIKEGDNLKYLYDLLDKDGNQEISLDEILFYLNVSQDDLKNMYSYICNARKIKVLTFENFKDAMLSDIQ